MSLHLRDGASPLEVAQWASHSPAVMFKHYANVIEELRGEPILPVSEQIDRARALVQMSSQEQLDEAVDNLMEHPTVASGGSSAAALFTPFADAPRALPPAAARRGASFADLDLVRRVA